jgi:hypothetical protein
LAEVAGFFAAGFPDLAAPGFVALLGAAAGFFAAGEVFFAGDFVPAEVSDCAEEEVAGTGFEADSLGLAWGASCKENVRAVGAARPHAANTASVHHHLRPN